MRRLIDANELIQKLQEAVTHKGMGAAIAGILIRYIEKMTTVDAVSVDEIKLHHILIDQNGIPEVKLQFGDRTLILRREDDPVDVREVVHGRWEPVECRPHLIYKCSECGDMWSYGAIIHMGFCPNCGAKMDGDGNG